MNNNKWKFFKHSELTGTCFTKAIIIPVYGTKIATKSDLELNSKHSPAFVPLTRFIIVMQEYFVEIVRKIEQIANKHRSELRTKMNAKGYVSEAHKKIMECLCLLVSESYDVMWLDSENGAKVLF